METAAIDWQIWLAPHGDDLPLDEALHHVAVDEGSRISLDTIRQQLDALASGIPHSLDFNTACAHLIHRLFVENSFRGDEQDYEHPQNSRIDRVLARQRGLPILLCGVTIEVARRMGLSLHGVGFPGHFLVATTHEPRLFLDPFHSGHVLREADLAERLQRRDGPLSILAIEEVLAPTSARDLILRVSTNLMGSWLRRGDLVRALRNADRRVLLRPQQPEFLRDRGWLHARLGRHAQAAFDLATYLDARPDAQDTHRVEQLLAALPIGTS